MASLLESIKSIYERNAQQYLYVPIPKNRVKDQADYDDAALQADASYFRLWLSEMFLGKNRQFFANRHPAVHSSVQMRFGNRDGVSFSYVARAPNQALANGVLLSYRLTDLIPFKGGVVDVSAALLALKGQDYLGTAISVLQGFSSLISAPLGQVLDVAEKVASGMEDLFGATDGKVHLPFHQAYTSAGGGGGQQLKPGYYAVILATAQQVAEDRLIIQNGRLYYSARAGDKPTPFDQHDYILFRIEGRTERDDWRLQNIQEPLNKAKEAIIFGQSGADAFKKAALAAAYTSPDLVEGDRLRVVMAIKQELAQVEAAGRAAARDVKRSLNDVVTTLAVPPEDFAALKDLSFDELMEYPLG